MKFGEEQVDSTDNWIVKVTVERVRGITVDNVSVSPDTEFPPEYFCMLSLLLEGTTIQQGPDQIINHWCQESANIQSRPRFALEALRSTDMCRVQYNTQNEGRAEAGQPQYSNDSIDGSRGSQPAKRYASTPSSGHLVWDETFALGGSHPDLYFGHEADATPDDTGEDCAGAEIDGHAALRPALCGQRLLLLLSIHTLNGCGAIVPLWQARASSRRSAHLALEHALRQTHLVVSQCADECSERAICRSSDARSRQFIRHSLLILALTGRRAHQSWRRPRAPLPAAAGRAGSCVRPGGGRRATGNLARVRVPTGGGLSPNPPPFSL